VNGAFQGARAAGRTERGHFVPDPIRYSVGDEVSDALTAADPSIGRVISRVGSVEVQSGPTRFAALARTVIGQQLSESSASAIIARVERDIGLSPEAVVAASDDTMRIAAVCGCKSEYLRGIAQAEVSGELDLDALDTLDDDHVAERLTRVRGVGRWTAQMFLLLALRRPDVIVLDDMGIRAAAGRMLGLGRSASVSELAEAAERWRPYRSAATLYLYRDRS
jgi:DNA-3-methyladenine glycosylase II